MSSKEINLTSELRGDYGELLFKIYNYKKNNKLEDVSKDVEHQHKDIDFIVDGVGVEVKTDMVTKRTGNFLNEALCQIRERNKIIPDFQYYTLNEIKKMHENCDYLPKGFMLKTQADVFFYVNVYEGTYNHFKVFDNDPGMAASVYKIDVEKLRNHLMNSKYKYWYKHHTDENVYNFIAPVPFAKLANLGIAEVLDEDIKETFKDDEKLMKFISEYHTTQQFRDFIIENYPEID